MSNNYFRFQQFMVHQQSSAMKVCTDACIFGAWTARHFQGATGNMLDIGSGTGLLSLMIAQQTAGRIDAVEIDQMAAKEAAANFILSPWRDRLQIIHENILFFSPSHKYELIFSNPPFYGNDLPPENAQKKLARHDDTLDLHSLFARAGDLLQNEGNFALLIAQRRGAEVEKIAAGSQWHITHKTSIRQSPSHAVFRLMYIFKKQHSGNIVEEELVIREADGRYSKGFSDLLDEYYLSKNHFQ